MFRFYFLFLHRHFINSITKLQKVFDSTDYLCVKLDTTHCLIREYESGVFVTFLPLRLTEKSNERIFSARLLSFLFRFCHLLCLDCLNFLDYPLVAFVVHFVVLGFYLSKLFGEVLACELQ